MSHDTPDPPLHVSHPGPAEELRYVRGELRIEEDNVRYLEDANRRLRNGLKWIQHLAAVHFMGGAFDPQHMRALCILAANTLEGTGHLRDYDEAITEARERAREFAEAVGIELITDEDLDAEDADERIAAKLAHNGSQQVRVEKLRQRTDHG